MEKITNQDEKQETANNYLAEMGGLQPTHNAHIKL
jgi:hypothetical protein